MMRLYILAFILLSSNSVVARDIEINTYHNGPPFIISPIKKTGLTYQVAKLLTDKSDGKYNFKVNILPRRRIDYLLKADEQMVIPWASPVWFRDKKMQKYTWSEEVFPAKTVLVTRLDSLLNFQNIDDLKGHSLAGLRGGKWPKIERLVKSGYVTRYDSATYESVISMVSKGRVDCARLPEVVAEYYIKKLKLKNKLKVIERPLNQVKRRFLINENQDVTEYIAKKLEEITKSGEMKKLLELYLK